MANGVQVDFISSNGNGAQAHGDVAVKLLANGMNPAALRTNDVLRKEEWKLMDDILIEEARRRLVFVDDLVGAGMTFSIGNGLGTTLIEWERVSHMEGAQISMDGVMDGRRDVVEFDLQQMPVPIIHRDFQINIRKLEASRRTGEPLDTTMMRQAARLVMEAVEDIALFGSHIQQSTAQIFGPVNFPQRRMLAGCEDWGDPSTTGQEKLQDLIDMIETLQHGLLDAAEPQGKRNNHRGPFNLYIDDTALLNLMNDWSPEKGDQTQMQRLMQIPQLSSIKALPTLDSTLMMMQMTPDVMDLVVGMEPIVIMWSTHGGMVFNFKIMTIMVPRPKSTYAGQSGIVHCTY